MARPVKTVDAKRVIELASKGLTIKEIAALEFPKRPIPCRCD
jgi:hypothetical protein